MTVQKGEGKYMILHGSYRLPVGRDLRAYISRPDLSGSFPTVIVAHGMWGLSSHVKAVCRRLARYGFAAICPDFYRGTLTTRLTDPAEASDRFAGLAAGRAARDLFEVFSNIEAAGTEWADVRRLGMLAIGAGGAPALQAAGRMDTLAGIALLYAPVTAESLAAVRVPVLGIYGADDEVVSAARTFDEHENLPVAVSFAFYGGVGHDFVDESREGYDHGSAEDAYGRVIGFFESKLAAPVGA